MHTRQIETFYWAARLGSFANAAKRLHATQSAVSMRIHELEARLGVKLFDRSQRSARLTPDGVSLLPLAEQMVRTMDQIFASVAKREAVSGYVRVGVVEIIAHTWLPKFLALLQRVYPSVKLELEVGLSHITEAKLGAGDLDMALTACELPVAHYVSVELGLVPFRWMAHPSLAGTSESLIPDQLANVPVILTSKVEHHRGSTLHWMTANSVQFNALTICNTFVTAAAMAKAGLGVALLPPSLYAEDIADGTLRVLSCTPEIEPLRIHSLRPRQGQTPAHRAVEWAAVAASSFPNKAVSDQP